MDSNKYIIREFYTFEPNVKLIKEAEEKNQPIILSGILQKANTLNRNGRVYPYDILKREAERYMEEVEKGRALGECVPSGTQIFTENGWDNIENIGVGEKIFTLDYKNNKLELQKTTNTIKKPYKDKMIRIYNSSNLDMMITKGHKVVLWDRDDNPYVLTGEELYNKLQQKDSKVSHSYIKNSGNWKGEKPEFFKLPNTDIKIKTEDWAAFLGIYISNGHSSGTKGGDKEKYIVGITQIKPHSKEKIRNLLNKLPFEYGLADNKQFIIKNKELHEHLFKLGNSYEKKIPKYAKNWSVELLEILLEWLLLGDGRNRKDRKNELIEEYSTTSKKLSDDVFEIMLKLGDSATKNITQPKDREIENRKILAENSHELYTIHRKKTKGIYLDNRFIKSELIDFNDNVYCVTVPNSTWLMKYNDKISWTHNCDHPESAVVSLRNASHKVIDMWWEGEALYGKVQLLDNDCDAARILKGLLKSGVMLGISSRGVGSVKSVKGEDIVQDDFELIAFDFVSSPSTPGAYMFKENKQWGITPITEEEYKKIKCENGICKIINEEPEKTNKPLIENELKNKEFSKKLMGKINNNFWNGIKI